MTVTEQFNNEMDASFEEVYQRMNKRKKVTEELVISGIAGRYPEADSIQELKDNLFSMKECASRDGRRWPPGLYDMPAFSHKLKDIASFDNEFFGIPEKDAHYMDHQIRIGLEVCYEAVLDAGIDPSTLIGTKTGLFLGNCMDEVFCAGSQDPDDTFYHEYIAPKLARSMGFCGPAVSVDTACASSLSALVQAISSIEQGECDAAIVAGTNVPIRPDGSLLFHLLKMTSQEGKCRVWDKNANGYGKGEAIAAIFLQKRSDAKRIYLQVIKTHTNCDGYTEEGITFPSYQAQVQCMREAYQLAGVHPHEVKYLEAHGTGTPVGDPQEAKAIGIAMCQGRKEPLLVGAVKSVLGHAEGSAGIAAISKVLIATEAGIIPPDQAFTEPNPNIPELCNGLFKNVTKPTPLPPGGPDGDIVGINSFGFGGVNVHVILKALPWTKDAFKWTEEEKIPRLVLMNGRTRESLDQFFQGIISDSKRFSPEFLSLVNDLSKSKGRMSTRGFMIAKPVEAEKIAVNIVEDVNLSENPPIWFAFGGMGSQWTGMGAELLEMPFVGDSLRECAMVLKDVNVDLIDLLSSRQKSLLDSPTNSFVALAAIQISLVDLLSKLGIVPDQIFGHSVGELVAGYADGCLTREETLLAAYWRGICIESASLPNGAMAAVGLSLDEATKKIEGTNGKVVVACHNAEDSVTIAGEQEAVMNLIEQLQAENVFARHVASCGVAFHSPCLIPAEDKLKTELKKVIEVPKRRSDRWLSTSVPESEWEINEAKYCSAEYLTNNFLSPVYFHEMVQKIPSNAIVVEIGPHALFQSIFKRSLGKDVKYVSFMKKNSKSNQVDILSGIGKLYNYGLNPAIETLYPIVKYPVPRGTPYLSPLIKWKHDIKFKTFLYPEYFNPDNNKEYRAQFDLQDPRDTFLEGHVVDGRNLFPATGYLMFAWRGLAKKLSKSWNEVPVVFNNVALHRATIIPKAGSGTVTFKFRRNENTGEFEIQESGSTVVSGIIRPAEDNEGFQFQHLLGDNKYEFTEDEKDLILETKDVYKELRVRGYDYGPTFQGIKRISKDGRRADVKWTGEWVSFVDAMLQCIIMGSDMRAFMLPTRFDYLRCDPKMLLESVEGASADQEITLPVVFDQAVKACAANGIEMHGLQASFAPRKAPEPVHLEKCQFIPYHERCSIDQAWIDKVNQYLRKCHQSLYEKIPKDITEDVDERKDEALLRIIQQESIDDAYEKFKFDLDHDFVQKTVRTERFLRPLLDTVLENLESRSVNVLEIGSSTNIFGNEIKKIFSLQDWGLNVNYTIANSNDSLDAKITKGTQVIKWEAEKSKIPTEASNQQLIIYRKTSLREILEFDKDKFDCNNFTDSLAASISSRGFFLLIIREHLTDEELWLANRINNSSFESYLKEIHCIKRALSERGFEVISHKGDTFGTRAILYRKGLKDISGENQTVLSVDNIASYEWVDELKQIVEELKEKPEGHNLWLIAKKSGFNGIIGLVKCLRQEPGGHKIRSVFVMDGPLTPNGIQGSKIFEELVRKDLVMNVFRGGEFGSFRHLKIEEVNEDEDEEGEVQSLTGVKAEHAYLNTAVKGDLKSFKWFEAEHKLWPKCQNDGEQLVQVHYAALNFKDVMLATGKLPLDALPGQQALQECVLGFEFSGIDENGNRVMGLIPSKALATTALTRTGDFLFPVPNQWSLEDAATSMAVYATAYFALIIRGNLRPGESVLIHSGTGGVGQAAINICLAMGCKVFTTVGSQDKKNYLLSQFPDLDPKHVGHSRSTSFERLIMRRTHGRGVDAILNSLADDKLQASIRVLAPGGRFLEIGKYDLSKNTLLDKSKLATNSTFHGIFLDTLFEVEGDSDCVLIRQQKQRLIELLSEGIKKGIVKPLDRTVFGQKQAEEAFRFMASGKHTGKVLLKIRDEEANQEEAMKVPAIPRTAFNPSKCYTIIGGLGGFGLELIRWMVSRGARKILVTSRSGARNPYQKYTLQHARKAGAKVTVSKTNVVDEESAEKLLAEAETLGPLGGIFNLALVLEDSLLENQTQEKYAAVIRPKAITTMYLDRATRKRHSKLEYFVCFSSVACGRGNAGQSNYGFGNSVMERICEDRRASGMHGLAIQWGAIGDVGVVAENMGNNVVIGGTILQRIPSCLSVLDKFLNMNEAVVSSLVKVDQDEDGDGSAKGSGDLIKSILHILGLKNTDSIDPKSTLGDLGLDSLMQVEVKQRLERDYGLIYSAQQIRELTIQDLKDINDKKSDQPTGDGNQAPSKLDDGLIIGAKIDESIKNLTSSQISIPLNEIKEGAPWFIFPAVEGHFSSMNALIEKIQAPLIGLLWNEEISTLSERDGVLERYASEMRNHHSGPYNIVGYSAGAALAYYMANYLKSKGDEVSNLILMDGSHKLFAAKGDLITDGSVSQQLDQEIELQTFAGIARFFGFSSIDNPEAMKMFVDKLSSASDTNQRIEMVIQAICAGGSAINESSIENLKRLMNGALKKIKYLAGFRSEMSRYQGNVTLIRSSEGVFRSAIKEVGDDYGLKECIEGECEVQILPGDHLSFIANHADHISKLINDLSL